MAFWQEIAKNQNIKKPVIFGLAGPKLSDEEKFFFAKEKPIGYILFSRNIKGKSQLQKLTKDLKEINGEVLILVDQEGGRVQRLSQPNWPNYPEGKKFANLYAQNPEFAQKECFKNFSQIASDLNEVGINTNCAPLLDVNTNQTHEFLKNRTFGNCPKQVTELGKQVCAAFKEKNILPIIKHIPGHGRGQNDSHLELPKVTTSLEELIKIDFAPFTALNQEKLAMSAHILYEAIDEKLPATISPKIIEIIRQEIGFKNIIMTDDISMKALKGKIDELSLKSLEAGCDLILHCNGKMTEMQKISQILPEISDSTLNKLIK